MDKELQPTDPALEPGESPFDVIKHVDPDGSEWWSAREMMPYLGYRLWQNMLKVIGKGRASCKNEGSDVASNFIDANKLVQFGKGRKPEQDVRLTRHACHLVTMNGDPTKPEIAVAQGYFSRATRAYELHAAKPAAKVAVPGAWSVRFREFMPHFSEVNINHPGDFTVVTALVPFFLKLEDELDRHLLPTRSSDLPDGSVGQCWANNRFTRGLESPKYRARLYLPARGYDVSICVYGVAERGPFEAWFFNTYVPEKLPNYLGNKESFNFDGPLPPASVALHTCRDWTGRRPHLNPRTSKQLHMVGDFAPVGTRVPRLRHDQPNLFA